jgi:hypothetical protein
MEEIMLSWKRENIKLITKQQRQDTWAKFTWTPLTINCTDDDVHTNQSEKKKSWSSLGRPPWSQRAGVSIHVKRASEEKKSPMETRIYISWVYNNNNRSDPYDRPRRERNKDTTINRLGAGFRHTNKYNIHMNSTIRHHTFTRIFFSKWRSWPNDIK